jgi:hypothetical protein
VRKRCAQSRHFVLSIAVHQKTNILQARDPFFESQQNHNLIGVANVFLQVLFHNVRLDYHAPIISQQGEVWQLRVS